MNNFQEYTKYIRDDLFTRDDLDIKFENTNEFPIVGILIPNYNHAKYIEMALKSVVQQDYPNKLIIIIDDCSTDNSVEKIQSMILNKKEIVDIDGNKIYVGNIFYRTNPEYSNLDGTLTPIILISLQKNAKQANARNIGISTTYNICGYYCQLDADDEYLPGKLSECMNIALTDKENIGIVYSDVIIHNQLNGIKTHEFREPYSWERLLQECIISNTMLINKKVFQAVGLYDKDISPVEDWDIQIRICEQFMAVHIPKPLSIYNVVDSSCTFTVNKERWNWCWNRIREKLKERSKKIYK
jgi:glycosyltransferase involved in cell wall biosynthesis